MQLVLLIYMKYFCHHLHHAICAVDLHEVPLSSSTPCNLCCWFTWSTFVIIYTMQLVLLIYMKYLCHHLHHAICAVDLHEVPLSSSTPCNLYCWFTWSTFVIIYTMQLVLLIYMKYLCHHLHHATCVVDLHEVPLSSSTPCNLCCWFTSSTFVIIYTMQLVLLIYMKYLCHHLHHAICAVDLHEVPLSSSTPCNLCCWFTWSTFVIIYTMKFVLLIYMKYLCHRLHHATCAVDLHELPLSSSTPCNLCCWFTWSTFVIIYNMQLVLLIYMKYLCHHLHHATCAVDLHEVPLSSFYTMQLVLLI